MAKVKYVVFKKNVYEPANEVYFQYDFEEALDFMDVKNHTTEDHWVMAEIFPDDKWYGRLMIWLARKGG